MSTVYVGGSYEVELSAGGSATTHISYYNALPARVMLADGSPVSQAYHNLTNLVLPMR